MSTLSTTAALVVAAIGIGMSATASAHDRGGHGYGHGHRHWQAYYARPYYYPAPGYVVVERPVYVAPPAPAYYYAPPPRYPGVVVSVDIPPIVFPIR